MTGRVDNYRAAGGYPHAGCWYVADESPVAVDAGYRSVVADGTIVHIRPEISTRMAQLSTKTDLSVLMGTGIWAAAAAAHSE